MNDQASPRRPFSAGTGAAPHPRPRHPANDHPSSRNSRGARAPARPRRGPSPITHHQPCAQPRPTAGAAAVPRALPPESSGTLAILVPPPGSCDAPPRRARAGRRITDAACCISAEIDRSPKVVWPGAGASLPSVDRAVDPHSSDAPTPSHVRRRRGSGRREGGRRAEPGNARGRARKTGRAGTLRGRQTQM